MVHESQSPVGRLHALWTLDGLGKLEPAGNRSRPRRPRSGRAGKRHHPGRVALWRIRPRWLRNCIAMAKDPDAKVRFQLSVHAGIAEFATGSRGPRRAALARCRRQVVSDCRAELRPPMKRRAFMQKAVTERHAGDAGSRELHPAGGSARRRAAKARRSSERASKRWRASTQEQCRVVARRQSRRPRARHARQSGTDQPRFAPSQPLLLKLFDSSASFRSARRAALDRDERTCHGCRVRLRARSAPPPSAADKQADAESAG